MGLRGGLGSSLIVHSLSSLVRFIWASGTGAPALLLALRLNWGTTQVETRMLGRDRDVSARIIARFRN